MRPAKIRLGIFEKQKSLARNAFSLIELLVVIGTVSVLAGLLIPTVAMVREQAERSVCASNLRQCGIALITCASDRQGKMANGANSPGTWAQTYASHCFSQEGGGSGGFGPESLGALMPQYCDNMTVFTCSVYKPLLRAGLIGNIDVFPPASVADTGDVHYFTYNYFPGRTYPAVYIAGQTKVPQYVLRGKGQSVIMSDVLGQGSAWINTYHGAVAPPGADYYGNHGRGFGAPISSRPYQAGHWWNHALRFSPLRPGSSSANSLLNDGSVQSGRIDRLKAYTPGYSDLEGHSWGNTIFAYDVTR